MLSDYLEPYFKVSFLSDFKNENEAYIKVSLDNLLVILKKNINVIDNIYKDFICENATKKEKEDIYYLKPIDYILLQNDDSLELGKIDYGYGMSLYRWDRECFHFGKHKGEGFDDVIIKDFDYIIWCINNIKSFGITTYSFYKYFIIKLFQIYYFERKRKTFIYNEDNLFEIFRKKIINKKLIDVYNLNLLKIHSKKVKADDEERYADELEEYDKDNDIDNNNRTSYSKYGGYNGWSDQAIDDAFEGDPMNTWNVD